MRNVNTRIAVILVLSCIAVTSMYGQDELTVKGLVTGRTADSLTIRTENGEQTVILTDSTKVQSPKGLGLRKQQMSWTSLIPGLKVTVKGALGAEGKVEAKTITFSKDDLQTASMIQAGLTPTEQKVAANQQNIAENQKNIATNAASISVNEANIATNKSKIAENEEEVSRRFSDLADYDVKDQAVVYFASGKSAMAQKDMDALTKLAAGASKLQGYIIEVKGYADSTGNAAANQTLSRDRAYTVVNYLMQNCNVPPRHIVSPGAMGISNPVSSNETKQGRSENRRVEVKVMVNKGLQSASN
jgi:outer membrane protein OmpA-like peptidoglycan-associated protein